MLETVWWDVALTNQSSRYWWILIPLCKAISLTSLATSVNSMGAVDRPEMVGLTLDVKAHVLPGLTVNWYMEVCVLEVYGGDPLP